MMVQVLRGIIVLVAAFALLTVSAEDENVSPDNSFDLMNDEQVNEDEEPALDNSVDLQEGQNFYDCFFFSGQRTNLLLCLKLRKI